MKEFGKYFNEKYSLPPTIERGPVGRDFKRGCGEAWKAALEWCLTWLDNDSPCGCDKISSEIIKRELNNE